MANERRFDFCIACRKETEYKIRKETVKEIIRDKAYEFILTKAYCSECGEEMSIPGFIDLNIRERDEQYRRSEGIISIEDIYKLMKIYNIGKAPLSLALGFGEVTISRYLEGQIPSKAYSAIMMKALTNPAYMMRLLDQNRDKVGETAYRKAVKQIKELKRLFNVSDTMLTCVAYIFNQMQEVTPLALQKILYYIQGLYMAIHERPFFEENCVAWQHGPVFENVYYLFRNFKYNPIDDDRFALLVGKDQNLSENEKKVIDLVIATFGKYSGKTLEAITHTEKPWREARAGYDSSDPSDVLIEKEAIQSYFKDIAAKYDINTKRGLNQYIDSKLETVY